MNDSNNDSILASILHRRFPVQWPGHLIGGEWIIPRSSGVKKSSINPNDGKELVATVFEKQIMDDAISLAFENRTNIANLALSKRLEILQTVKEKLETNREALSLVLRCEAGKAKWEADLDVNAAIRYLDWVSHNGDTIFDRILAPARLGRTKGEFKLLPIGVTAGFLPFSTPITSFVFYFCASTLAGCPLVLTSSTHAMLTCSLLGELTRDMSLPQGLLSIVFGGFNEFKSAVSDKRVAGVLYTGSREHCETIKKESRVRLGRQAVLQSGGKNAVIVHSSADMETALKCVTYGALNSAGQRCSSTSRVFVYKNLRDEFADRLATIFKGIATGPTDQEGSEALMGPLYSNKAVDKFLRYQTMANREAETTLLWGKAQSTERGGFFVSPGIHLMKSLDNTTAYQSNVLFSPDLAIYDYDVLGDAIEQINTTNAAFSVSFIGDKNHLDSVRDQFLAPNLLVNLPTVELDATLPLAGRLESGHHRFHGPGIALYLCYPQVVDKADEEIAVMEEWPWIAD